MSDQEFRCSTCGETFIAAVPPGATDEQLGDIFSARHVCPKPACQTCEDIKRAGGFGPSHDGSRGCESGSIASGGTRAHCTCDGCF